MMRRRRSPASGMASLMSFGLEAQQVMALRLAKIALGGQAAQREARLMIDEKVATGLRVQQAALSSMMMGRAASAPAQALATYRRAVRANRRRLLRGG